MRIPLCPSVLIIVAIWAGEMTSLLAEPTQSAPASADEPRRGAVIPWKSHEAEAGEFSPSAKLVVGKLWGEPVFEARDKQAVELTQAGDFLQWRRVEGAGHLTVRYSVAEHTAGTLEVYINDRLAGSLQLHAGKLHEPKTECPNGVVRYWDEVSLATEIPPQATVRLRWTGEAPCLIDFLELEIVPPPLTCPDDSWVVVPGNDRAALVKAIDEATQPGAARKVWLPAGIYHLDRTMAIPEGVTLRGAGIFHTILHKDFGGPKATLFRVAGAGNTFGDFRAIDCLDALAGNQGNSIVNASDSKDCVIENIWTEYAGLVSLYRATGAIVRGCRVRNGYKDAIHFAGTARDGLVENCAFRNTGDDCAAFVSYGSTGLKNHVVRHNTMECSYWGRAISLQGGRNITVEHNVVTDCSRAGILVAIDGWGNPYVFWPHNLDFTVMHNTIIRCGNQVNQAYGAAVAVWGRTSKPMRGRIEHNDIVAPPFHGVQITGHVGRAGTDEIVLFRHNRIGTPMAGTPWERLHVALEAGSAVMHDDNAE